MKLHGFSLDPNVAMERNPGNFLALVKFRVDAGDSSLLRDFHKTQSGRGQNVTYLSPVIQNELIECCGQYVGDSIVQEAANSSHFSVCADEAADVGTQEQLPLVIRYVNKHAWEDLRGSC